jgi:hypothetical protein
MTPPLATKRGILSNKKSQYITRPSGTRVEISLHEQCAAYYHVTIDLWYLDYGFDSRAI